MDDEDDRLPGEDDQHEDDDPVVRELSVYLSTQLGPELHVIQYPNRPYHHPYDLPRVARVKPANQLLELDYDLCRSRESAVHIDDDAPRHLRLDKIKLQSSYLDPMTTYAVGIIQGNELHLTPVAGVYQMRPSVDHVDAAGDPEVEGDLDDFIEDDEDTGTGSASGKKAGEKSAKGQQAALQPVKLRHIEIKKKESEKAAAARRTSYAWKRQQEEAEPWVELEVHGYDETPSIEEFEKMFCSEPAREIKFKGGRGVYAELYRAGSAKPSDRPPLGGALRPSNIKPEPDGQGAPSRVVSIKELKGAEQVVAILGRAGIVSFSQILDLAGPSVDPAAVLELVKKSAVLVRGNWVRKTSLYGLSPKLAEARDAILIMLEKYGGINRFQFAEKVRLKEEEMKLLLDGFAVLNKDLRMWELKVPDDVEFIARYPEVLSQQQKLWREKEKGMSSLMAVLGEPDCPYPGPVVVNPALTERATQRSRVLQEPSSAARDARISPPPQPSSQQPSRSTANSLAAEEAAIMDGNGDVHDRDMQIGEVSSPMDVVDIAPTARKAKNTVLAPGQRAGPKPAASKFKPKGR